MLRWLKGQLAVMRDHRHLDSMLDGYLASVGIEIVPDSIDQRSRFAIAQAKFSCGASGLCTYGLSGFSVIRNEEIVRIELCIETNDTTDEDRLHSAGRLLYQSCQYPDERSSILRSLGFAPSKTKEVPFSGPMASTFAAIWLTHLPQNPG